MASPDIAAPPAPAPAAAVAPVQPRGRLEIASNREVLTMALEGIGVS